MLGQFIACLVRLYHVMFGWFMLVLLRSGCQVSSA